MSLIQPSSYDSYSLAHVAHITYLVHLISDTASIVQHYSRPAHTPCRQICHETGIFVPDAISFFLFNLCCNFDTTVLLCLFFMVESEHEAFLFARSIQYCCVCLLVDSEHEASLLVCSIQNCVYVLWSNLSTKRLCWVVRYSTAVSVFMVESEHESFLLGRSIQYCCVYVYGRI